MKSFWIPRTKGASVAVTMIHAKKRARDLTMACWWPSKITGMRAPCWGGILDELRTLANAAIECRNDFREAEEIYGVMARVAPQEVK